MATSEETTEIEPENTARVDTLLEQFRTQLSATMVDIRRVEKEFSQYKNHSYVTVKSTEPGLIKRTNAKMVVVITAMIDVFLLVVLAIHHQSTKEEKEKEAAN